MLSLMNINLSTALRQKEGWKSMSAERGVTMELLKEQNIFQHHKDTKYGDRLFFVTGVLEDIKSCTRTLKIDMFLN